MPQIGWFEILIIVAVAIIVIGPKDFPIMLKKIGSWIGTAKRYINQIQQEVTIIDENENEMIVDLLKENFSQHPVPLSLGNLGTTPVPCPSDCCPSPSRSLG